MLYTSEQIDFEWDEEKALQNEKKHKISFERAVEVFSDPFARVKEDRKHSQNESRFHIIGMDLKTRVLLVCYCERNNGETLRLISARKATKQESLQYWDRR